MVVYCAETPSNSLSFSFSVFNILHLDLPLFMEDSGYRNQGKLLTSVLTQGILLSQTDARWPPAISA